MYRTVKALLATLLLWLLPWVATAQIEVSLFGDGTITITQPDGNPTLTCPPDCTTVIGTNDPNGLFTFTVNPAPGWQLIEWFVNGQVAPLGPTVTLGPFASSVFGSVDATLAKVMTVVVDGQGQGVVTSNDGNINCTSGQTCSAIYDPFDSSLVTLTATPLAGFEFLGWDLGPNGVACIFEAGNTCTIDPAVTGVGGLPNTISATFSLPDADQDGVPDINDLCPNTIADSFVDANGCTADQLDDDNDGVTNDIDQCPNTPPNTPVDAQGCPTTADTDGDGIPDTVDQCPNTPPNTPVDAQGCPLPPDTDGDGVPDGTDQCPNTPANTPVDAVGCPLDSDSDGVPDTLDECPNTPANTVVDAQGCPLVANADSDGDRVVDAQDQCPNTPLGTAVDTVGCPLRGDADGDGVTDNLDQCPNTPMDVEADETGCPLEPEDQPDEDGDSVPDDADACPGTPAGEMVDTDGCSDSQKDEDGDDVNDARDLCPATPMGEPVDDDGCGDSQKDEDGDEVSDDRDLCPATPTGEAVDDDGCSDSQKDTDNDTVVDAQDLCPATPAGEPVDSTGCAPSQKDTDGDLVNDALDLCPATPMGQTVDTDGCSTDQRDDDGDGVPNGRDQCPDSDPGDTVLETGCTAEEQEIKDFGPLLVEIEGLSGSERSVAGAIDTLCPQLIEADADGALSPAQQELRERCSSLKNIDTSQDLQQAALEVITPDDLAIRTDLALEVGRTQLRLVQNRINRVRYGGGGGFTIADLTMSFAGEDVSMGVIERAVAEELEESGGGGSDFSDFGNWGFYLQGDIEIGERDTELDVAGYDFDFWLLSAGADYRFGARGYLGASLDFGSSSADTTFSRAEGDILGVTAYGGLNWGEGGYVDVIVAWLDQDYSLTRDVEYSDIAGDFSARHFGDTGGTQYSAGLNLGYMFTRGGLRIGPTISLMHIDGEVDAYEEEAAIGDVGAWTLAYGANAYGLTALAVGIQADYAWLMDWGVLMPGFTFTFNSDDESSDLRVPLRFVNDPFAGNAPITLNRSARDGEYWEGSLNLAGQFSYGISAYAGFRIIGARSGFQQTGYTLGLRWDKVF